MFLCKMVTRMGFFRDPRGGGGLIDTCGYNFADFMFSSQSNLIQNRAPAGGMIFLLVICIFAIFSVQKEFILRTIPSAALF